ncbi:flagellar basal body-associated FliL family protein [Rhodoferax lacus]|nr:flagellar basal body-associated FliL family protein [Rhodoferax lacus]
MATAPEASADDKAPAKKSKKMLIIIGAVVAVLALGGAGFYFLVLKPRAAAAAEEDGGDAPKAAAHDGKVTPPAYLPMDNMVVNLADAGGDRVAQVGVTLVVADAHASDTVKAFLPTIRSGVLMLISQKTAVELLTPEGKEALAKAILREAITPFGGGEEEAPAAEAEGAKKKKKAAHAEYPVTGVLFSSFIIQ